MTNDKITATRELLLDETYALKRDAAQVVEDAKTNLYAHLVLAKEMAKNALAQARNYANRRLFRSVCISVLLAGTSRGQASGLL